MIKPPHNYYVFSDGYRGSNANIDYGFVGGKPLIFELIFDLKRRKLYLPNRYVFYIQKDGNNLIYLDSAGTGHYRIVVADGGGLAIYAIYPQLFDFDVMHILVDSTYFSVFIDGQRIIHDTVTPRLPILSGNCLSTFLGGTANQLVHNICGTRIWEVDAIPAGAVEEIHKKVMDPWRRSPVFGDGNMVCEWLLDENVGDASVVIPNSEPGGGGLGPLSITGGTQFQNARKLWRTP